jgi:hypothetical protein
MKNFVKWLGIIALVAVIGFSMAACGGDDDGGNGNGNGTGGGGGGGGALSGEYIKEGNARFPTYFEFTGSDSWRLVTDGNYEAYKGTYTRSGNTVTLNWIGYTFCTLTIIDSKTLQESITKERYIKK